MIFDWADFSLWFRVQITNENRMQITEDGFKYASQGFSNGILLNDLLFIHFLQL